MIMAYDEGAWHPNGAVLNLWLLLAVASLVPLLLLAMGRPGQRARPLYYLATVTPFAALLLLNVYSDYGFSGAYTGEGTIGAGAHIDVVKGLSVTLRQYAVFFWPTVIGLLLVKWAWRRKKRFGLVYWCILGLLMLAQTLFAVVLTAIMGEA